MKTKNNLIGLLTIFSLGIIPVSFANAQTDILPNLEVEAITSTEVMTTSEKAENQNEMLMVETTSGTNVSIVAGTSTALASAVDSLISKMESSKGGEYCELINDSVNSLSSEERASLAWKSTSYSKNLGLEVSANATAEEKAEYESLKKDYIKITEELDNDKTAYSSNKASVRAGYLELMSEYRSGKVDNARVAKIKSFLEKAGTCFKDGVTVKTAVGASTSTEQTVEPEVLIISRADLTEEDIAMETEAMMAGSVKSDESLKAYIKAVVASDESVKKIATNENQTEVTYKQKGRFLGFIPVKMNVKTSVKADGSIKVSYPWYKFMTTAVGGKVTSEAVLEGAVLTDGEVLTPADQAVIVENTQKAFVNLSASKMEENTELNDKSADDSTMTEDLE